MTELSLREIQLLELEILKDVADFCEEKGIDYFITAGTLLGAARHQGFIPWDDDIDISMPRKDYERFLREYRSKRNFKVISARYDRKFFFPVAKVASYDNVVKRYRRADIDFGVNIDVFPVDSFQSEMQVRRISSAMSIFRRLIDFGALMCFRNFFRSYGLRSLVYWPLSNQYFANWYARMIDRLAKRYRKRNGRFLAVVAGPITTPKICKPEDLFPTEPTGVFEGYRFRIPRNADLFLTRLYGNWRQLPDIQYQKAPHHRRAFTADRETAGCGTSKLPHKGCLP